MNQLYKKSAMNFALVTIAIYVLVAMFADSVSISLGVEKLITTPALFVLSIYLYRFIKKQGQLQYYGLCPIQGKPKEYVYFLPLVFIISMQLWGGITFHNARPLEIITYVLSMCFVGFLEEVIFRGFLFKAMYEDNPKTAIIVSSILFGIGHIVNLLSGAALVPTLLQLCYATVIGYVFVILFLRSKSLLPAILTHACFNALGIFGQQPSSILQNIIYILLFVTASGYAFYLKREVH